jgi:hypothetical protein
MRLSNAMQQLISDPLFLDQCQKRPCTTNIKTINDLVAPFETTEGLFLLPDTIIQAAIKELSDQISGLFSF